MTWTYKFERLDRLSSSFHDAEAAFNAQGADGWEFVCVQQFVFGANPVLVAIFKKSANR
jgi:hypothetical protein